MQKELSLPVSQTLALFVKLIRKISKKLVDIQKEAVGADIPLALHGSRGPVAAAENIGVTEGEGAGEHPAWKPLEKSIDEELDEAGDDATHVLRERQRAMFDALDLTQ